MDANLSFGVGTVRTPTSMTQWRMLQKEVPKPQVEDLETRLRKHVSPVLLATTYVQCDHVCTVRPRMYSAITYVQCDHVCTLRSSKLASCTTKIWAWSCVLSIMATNSLSNRGSSCTRWLWPRQLPSHLRSVSIQFQLTKKARIAN